MPRRGMARTRRSRAGARFEAGDIAASGHNVEASLFVEVQCDVRTDGPEHLKPVGETEFAVGQAALAGLAGMKELASCPNVSIKLGGLLMCLGNFDFATAKAPPTSEQLAALGGPTLSPA
jgi:hypothetical protein